MKVLGQSTSILALVALLLQIAAATGALAADKGRIPAQQRDRSVNAPTATSLKGDANPTIRNPIIPRTTDLHSAPQSAAVAPVPRAGIPVLENALGDLDQDSVLDLWDLVRLRELVHGWGANPTPYELSEGDLDQDLTIELNDLSQLNSVLARRTGPSVVLGADGGVVSHGTTNVVIPPGALPASIVINVTQLTREKVETEAGLDLAYLSGIGMDHMASFTLSSPQPLPQSLPIQLIENTPEGMSPQFTAAGLFQSYPDLDGDGQPELRQLGELTLNEDTSRSEVWKLTSVTSVRTSPIPPPPTIVLESGPEHEAGELAILAFSPSLSEDALPLHVTVGGGAGGISITQPTDIFASEAALGEFHVDSISVRIPPVAGGEYQCHVTLDQFSTQSNAVALQIVEPPSVASADSIIIAFFDSVAAMIPEWYYEDTTQFVAREAIQSLVIGGTLDSLQVVLLSSDAIVRNRIAASIVRVLQEVAGAHMGSKSRSELGASCGQQGDIMAFCTVTDPCAVRDQGCCGECLMALETRLELLEGIAGISTAVGLGCLLFPPAAPGALAATGADLVIAAWIGVYGAAHKALAGACTGRNCPRPARPKCRGGGTQRVECYDVGSLTCTPAMHCFSLETCPSPGKGSPPCPQSGGGSALFSVGTSTEPLSLLFAQSMNAGSIVRASSPLIASAIVDFSGSFTLQLPTALIDTTTLSLYDPKTGMSDPVFWQGTFRDLSGYPLPIVGVWAPNMTSTKQYLTIGDYISDSIILETAIREYWFQVSESDIPTDILVGLSSNEPLFIRITDPNGTEFFRDTSTTCELVGVHATTIGNYTIRVTTGFGNGDGPFVIGVNHAPYPSIPYLCDAIPWDTLYASYSSYVTTVASNVASGDSVIVQAGTTIEFEPGGSILGSGILRGTGTAQNPIILKPATSEWPFSSAGVPKLSEAHFPGSEAD